MMNSKSWPELHEQVKKLDTREICVTRLKQDDVNDHDVRIMMLKSELSVND
jgi:hypothetical protein